MDKALEEMEARVIERNDRIHVYPMRNKTPEERRAIAAKSHATRRARREAEEAARLEARAYAGGLRDEIAALERRIAGMKRMETMQVVSSLLTGKALLRAEEIAAAAQPWEKLSGVYFLLYGDEIVYVGQSVNVYSRIAQHARKLFDRYAVVPCHAGALDKLESLYIHLLRPKLNGVQKDGACCAPISLTDLLGMVPNDLAHSSASSR
jgi:hypothetical protein